MMCVALGATATACIVYTKVDVKRVDPRQSRVQSAVKAHLADGSTILYPHGFTVVGDTVRAHGFRYAPGSSDSTLSTFVSLDSVVGMETFETNVRIVPTVLVSTGVDAVVAINAAYLLKVLFGSCPTFYSDSGGRPVLETEGFSYSIAPLFEQRTVSRLRGGADANGQVALEVRNEALETHYLNQVSLIEASHGADEFVLPDGAGRPLALRGLVAPASVRDRAGRDLSAVVAAADGIVFTTDPRTLAGAHGGDMDDYLDVAVARPRSADSVAVHLRMRNSLLNTVFLYEQILGAPGARSLDWIGHDLQRITGAIDVGRWYGHRMGMGVAVMEQGRYRPVVRISDSGPIAFHDVAVLVPASPSGQDDSVHIRLSFVVDEWRVDEIRVAAGFRRLATRTISPSEVVTSDSTQRTDALRDLSNADERYVVTSPGQSFAVRFDVGRGAPGQTRTFLLASQGYYTEWVRGAWIRSASGTEFTPGDDALMSAIARWRTEKDTFERAFFASRAPVR